MVATFTAVIAANAQAATAALYERMANAAVYSRAELDARWLLLNNVAVTHTPRSVSVRFLRGDETLADQLGTAILDMASEGRPADVDGLITTRGRTVTLTFAN